MNLERARREGLTWAFWGAGALAAIAGLVPVVLAGPSDRISDVIVPFWVAAIAFGACAVLYRYGRIATSIVYLVAGLAIVIGLLAEFSLPLLLAVVGTCPASPAPCTSGLPRPLTDAETTGMSIAAATGTFSLLVGFVGLRLVYHRTARARAVPPPLVQEKRPEKTEPDELPAHQEPELPELPAPESTLPSA